jgi:hypothetical protein
LRAGGPAGRNGPASEGAALRDAIAAAHRESADRMATIAHQSNPGMDR